MTLGVIQGEKKQYLQAIESLKRALAVLDGDNTVLGSEVRVYLRGLITYQLAKFYSQAGTAVDVVTLLKEAIKLKPVMKNNLKYDYQKCFFKNQSLNSQFLELVS